MLPSTGHFKAVGCPFLESGLCERPYCHFKHAKGPAAPLPSRPLLRRLVVSAVERLMRPPTPSSPPPSAEGAPPKPTYNPTPISELNRMPPSETAARRHIPVPYTPCRPRPLASPEGYVPFGGPPTTATYNPGGAARPRDEPAYSPVPASAPAPSPGPFPFGPGKTFMRYRPTPLRKDEPPAPAVPDTPDAPDPLDVDDFEGLEPELEMLGRIVDEETDLGEAEPAKEAEPLKAERKRREKRPDDKARRDKKKSRRSPSRGGRDGKNGKNDRNDRNDKNHRNDKNYRNDRNLRDDKPDKKTENGEPSKRRDRSRNERKRSRRGVEDRPKEAKRDRRTSPEVARSDDERASTLDFFESDEDSVARECLKIFEEYVPAPKKVSKLAPTDETPIEDANAQVHIKKRVAHSTEPPTRRLPPVSLPPNHKSNAVRLAVDRTSIVKRFHESRAESVELSVTNSSVKLDLPVRSSSGPSKIRIAHVPYVSTMLNAKKNLIKVTEPPKTTVVQTVSKGTTRVAHVPNDKYCDRPGVLEPLASKIPLTVRSKYLNLMIDECLKIYLIPHDAYTRAQQEELSTSKKCTATQIYKNSAILTITRLRKEVKETNGIKKNTVDTGISHDKILVGKLGEKSSWSIETKSKKDFQFSDELKGVKFYNNIARWILTEKELQENGFPRPHPHSEEKGRAIIYTKNTKQKPPKGNMRSCCRCGKEYAVNKKGFAVLKEECIYHPNNKYRFRGEVKYQCCSQDSSSDGCLSATTHVYEYVNHDDLRGFVKTLSKDNSESLIDHGVYALDCEMCYTTHGLDLTRVTVIDSSCKVIYESLVKPFYPIIDYNTRYSGLTEEILKDCTTTLLEVQATFLHMFSNKTILVGHSLESDLKALKLIHDSVVDTSVLFPHKMGLPYKRALRNLSSEYLKKIIQNSVDGHDSAEDALVCMELIIWKLKEELKLR